MLIVGFHRGEGLITFFGVGGPFVCGGVILLAEWVSLFSLDLLYIFLNSRALKDRFTSMIGGGGLEGIVMTSGDAD